MASVKITASVGIIFFVTIIIMAILWKPDEAYNAILGDFNEELIERKIGVGGLAKITFPSNCQSVFGYYALYNVVFKPELTTEQITKGVNEIPWQCESKPRDWGEYIGAGDMVYFDVSVEIPIPDNLILEGKTISGIIEMEVEYPVETKPARGAVPGEFENRRKHLEKSATIHIFTNDELKALSELESQMTLLYPTIAFLFIGSLILLTLSGAIIWRRKRLRSIDAKKRNSNLTPEMH